MTSAHSGRWNMCATEDSHLHTAYRPWAALTPPHLNTPLLEKYQHGVLMHIMAHPGITLVSVQLELLHVHIHVYTAIEESCIVGVFLLGPTRIQFG